MAFTFVFLVGVVLQASKANAIDRSILQPNTIPVDALPPHCRPVFSDPSDPSGRNPGLHQIHSDIVCIGGFCYKKPRGIPVAIPRIPGTQPFDQPPPIIEIDEPERQQLPTQILFASNVPARPIGPSAPSSPILPLMEVNEPVRPVGPIGPGLPVDQPDPLSEECKEPDAIDRKFFVKYPNYYYPSYPGSAVGPQPYAPAVLSPPYGPTVHVSPWM